MTTLPETTETPPTIPLKGKCHNCGTEPLDTPYCPNCGQENVNRTVPLGIFLQDILEEFVKWDGRLFTTVYALLFRPGLLTSEYNAGRRVRYLSPFKMYFIVSAIFFFLFSLHPIARTIDAGKQEISFKINGKERHAGEFETAYIAENEAKKKKKEEEADNLEKLWGYQFGKLVMRALDTPGVFVANLVQTTAKILPFLLPFYAGVLTLLYFRQRRYYVEQLVFIAHNTTLLFLLAIVVDLIGRVWKESGWFLLLFPFYEFLALRRVYGEGIRATLFKQMLFGTFSFFLLFCGAVVTIVVAILTQ